MREEEAQFISTLGGSDATTALMILYAHAAYRTIQWTDGLSDILNKINIRDTVWNNAFSKKAAVGGFSTVSVTRITHSQKVSYIAPAS